VLGLADERDDEGQEVDHGQPGQARRPDANQVARETASALEAIATGIGLIDPAELDMAQVPVWAASITASLRTVNRLATILAQMTAANGDPGSAAG
jgi:hypothetical protein